MRIRRWYYDLRWHLWRRWRIEFMTRAQLIAELTAVAPRRVAA